MLDLLPFQRRFLTEALKPRAKIAALSLPRGNGKSALAGHLVTRILSPSDGLFRPGTESVLVAASIEQARVVFRFARAALENNPRYRFLDSHTRIGITYTPSNTRLRVIASNGRTAMGLVGCPWAICDEPGAWQTIGGQLVWDALVTAQGKPDSPLKILAIGTLAPAMSGWWHDLIAAGSTHDTHVLALQGDPAKWDEWQEIKRCNPLMAKFPDSRKQLMTERKQARSDTRLKARFLSYRLNLPSADESEILLTAEDWKRVLARPVAEIEGRPIVGVDLGAGRSWSAAVAIWPNGRIEAIAFAPGIPGLADQERRDRVPPGLYQKLADSGRLMVAEGLRVQPVADLVDEVCARWDPAAIIADRFRHGELLDHAPCEVIGRVTRWSECAADIRALRKLALDGPLSVEGDSRLVLTAALAAAMVKNDDAGNCRLVKRGTNSTGRDDAAAALLLAAGETERRTGQEPLPFMLLSAA